MAIVNWTDSMSVKIESIDNQHKRLFDLINEFYDKLSSEDKHENLIKLIHGMRDYTVLHFSNEEKYMKKFNYPDFENHQKEHAKFVGTVNEYVERVKSGKLIVSVEITNFLKNWIVDHIMVTDKKYTDFFIKNGVK
jgi:hemerythrin-like metal-binding protein